MGSNPPTSHGATTSGAIAGDHEGQHRNCRACGTNPRALGTNPRGPKPPDPPDPDTAQLRAQDQLMAENAERLDELEQTPRTTPDEAQEHLDRIREELRTHRRPDPEPCTRCHGTGHEPDQEDHTT